MTWINRRFSICSAALIALGLAAGNATADSASDFYKDKTVRIVVGYGAGGGYDAYARMMAPYLAARLGTSVIVENKPGGGGLNALTALVRQPGDGLRLLLLNVESAALTQAIGKSGKRYDLRTLTFLARVSYENRTLLGKRGTTYEKFGAFMNSPKQIIFGAGSREDTLGRPAVLFCYAFHLNCKLITGYKGAAEVALAVERGEIDAMVTSESQSAKLVKSSPLVAVAILSPNKAPLLPAVPTIFELTKPTAEQKKWIDFNAQLSDLGRSLVVPGDTPADRVAFLKKAVDGILADPKLIAEGERLKRPIDYESGAKNRKTLEDFFKALDPATTRKVKELLTSR